MLIQVANNYTDYNIMEKVALYQIKQRYYLDSLVNMFFDLNDWKKRLGLSNFIYMFDMTASF